MLLGLSVVHTCLVGTALGDVGPRQRITQVPVCVFLCPGPASFGAVTTKQGKFRRHLICVVMLARAKLDPKIASQLFCRLACLVIRFR
uniref:Putative secreted protein n=1 Tax=Ixodes scapularis TaxID=6945 RepID=A0A4D5RAP3_IXOSC